MISTPIDTIEDRDSTIAAMAETPPLTNAKGGELIETIAPIAMPAHITTWAADTCVMNKSSATVCPNHVHSKPLTAR